MALTKVTISGSTDTISEGFTKVNDIIDDLAAVTTGLGASTIGVYDVADNMAATDVEAAIAEVYTDIMDARSLADIFANNPDTTTGLTWGYKAGAIRVDNVVTAVAASTIALTNTATNYIEVDSAGTVSRNTTSFTSGKIPLYTVVCAGGIQTVVTDKRAWFHPLPIPSTNGQFLIGSTGADPVLATLTGTAREITITGGAGSITVSIPAQVNTKQYYDGTNTIDFPTNGMAAAKFMLGNSNTIAWFYLNTAPPGWKVLSTGADTVLSVSGGAGLYNANGGTAGGESWANLKAHTHTGPSHTHTGPSHTHTGPSHTHPAGGLTAPNHTHTLATGTPVGSRAAGDPIGTFNTTGGGSELYIRGAGDGETFTPRTITTGNPSATAVTGNTEAAGTGATGADGTGATGADGTGATGAQSTADIRPTASVGKLFQLDSI